MSDTTSTTDVLASGKPPHFPENSAPAVKPNSLPLNEINLPSFTDISPFSTSPNNPTANECATSSNFYPDLSDKFGVMTVNDFHLQRHQQKHPTDFTSSLMKSKLATPEDLRNFVEHQQNQSPFKVVQTTSHVMSQNHSLHSPYFEAAHQQTLRSLITDGQQFQPNYSQLPPYSSYSSQDSLQHDLNSLSNYFGSRIRAGDNSLPHLSPNVDELKSFSKNPEVTPSDGDVAGNFNSPFMPVSSENESLKLVSPMKIPDFSEATMNNYSSNVQLNEALLLKLRQQNALLSKPPPINLIDLHQIALSKKDFLVRQALSSLGSLDQDQLTKLYLNEFIRENPNFLANQLLSTMPMSSLNLPLNFHGGHVESYSRKVFVGGLPPDSDEDEITASFRQFGPLIVDWPHKAETKTNFPPKGYCFLLFQDEMSVQNLIDACIQDDGKYYWCITCSSQKDKPVRRVQIRPWCLVDSDFVLDGSQPLDLRKTIFVGGVPRPLRAAELALAMERLYGGVCYAGIDTDPELKYPKGAGRVSFSNQQSYIAAISARFVQLQLGDIDKRVEVKPYVLDDQLCDECQGQKCAGKSAPYFCANVACLQYYCEVCWVQIHSRTGREFHKPLVKEGADRPKSIPPFKW